MDDIRAYLVSALAGVLIQDGKVLLLKRQNTNFFDGYWALPAGKLDPGETPREGLVRELKEEIDVDTSLSTPRTELTMFARSSKEGLKFDGRFYYLKKFDSWEGVPRNAEPNKASEIAWFPLDALPENITPYHKIGIEKILDGATYHEFEVDF